MLTIESSFGELLYLLVAAAGIVKQLRKWLVMPDVTDLMSVTLLAKLNN
jgi:hypothetical protein